jgi:hypothetical protein
MQAIAEITRQAGLVFQSRNGAREEQKEIVARKFSRLED